MSEKNVTGKVRLQYDYSALRRRLMSARGGAPRTGELTLIGSARLRDKLLGKEEWTQSEIALVCIAVGIPAEEIGKYFFTVKVQFY